MSSGHVRPRGRSRVRPLIACPLAAAIVMATAHMALASLFLIFDRTSGSPGTVVTVRTAGNGACALCPRRMPLYLVQAEAADRIEALDDPRLLLVGALLVDREGNGNGVFTVPDVPRGPYVVMTSCEPCAPTSAGRTILPLGPFPPFRVLGIPSQRSAPFWPWILGVGGAVMVAALVWGIVEARSLRLLFIRKRADRRR